MLKILLNEIKDETISNWVNSEINGYSQEEQVPEYRKIACTIVGTAKGYAEVLKNTNIPIKDEYKEMCNILEIRSGINVIHQMSIAEKESESHSLHADISLDFVNAISLFENATITHAHRTMSIYAYTNILGKLKSKLIAIFLELEKQYGNLDNYYIEFKNTKEEKRVIQNICNIIYNVDNSISIGHGNNISKSNIGENNEN